MYGIPQNLDLSKMVGESTTQLCLGHYDFQFSIGDVHFAVQSEIKLTKNGEQVASWKQGSWASSEFWYVMNVIVDSYDIPSDRELVITFENGYALHIFDNSDQYESMQIKIKGEKSFWII